MAKPNYSYEKRQRELEKKKKKEDKAMKKASSASDGSNHAGTAEQEPSSAATTGETPVRWNCAAARRTRANAVGSARPAAAPQIGRSFAETASGLRSSHGRRSAVAIVPSRRPGLGRSGWPVAASGLVASAQADGDHRINWVQRNNATVLPVSRCVTTASHTCVVLPRCCAVATQSSVPSRAVPRWLDFSSIVVKPLALPAGSRCNRIRTTYLPT